MKHLGILLIALPLLLVLGAFSNANAQSTSDTTPPRPFPEPGTTNFPTPDKYMMGLTSSKLDQVSKETEYFKSKTYKKKVDEVIALIDSSVASANGATISSAKLSEIKLKALSAIQELTKSSDGKKTQLLASKALSDKIGTELGVVDTAVDTKILDDVKIFFDATVDNDKDGRRDGLKTYMLDAYLDIAKASKPEQIKTILNDSLVFMDKKMLTSKALGARIASQNVLYYSSMIQGLVEFETCSIPYYKTAGFSSLKAENYFTKYMDEPYLRAGVAKKCDINPNPTYKEGECSLAKIDWYSSVGKINEDAKYRKWAEGSFGAREEFRLTAEILSAPSCNGTSDCKKQADTHITLGNAMLADIFHLAYYGYDDFIMQKENDTTNTIKAVDVKTLESKCSYPLIPWMKDGTSGKPSWFPNMKFPAFGATNN